MLFPRIFKEDDMQDAFEIMGYAEILKMLCDKHNWDPHKVLDVSLKEALYNELENKV
jgi:hypothetical protein